MDELPEEWRQYARTQALLANRTNLDDQSWGLEAALDHCLDTISDPAEETHSPKDVETVVASARGRERHRRRLRLVYLPVDDSFDPLPLIEARSELRAVLRSMEDGDRTILMQTYLGSSGAEIAAVIGVTPAAFRKRISRLRHRISAAA
jgi:DNA-directed RNA polymerase specialized sigma24 family protein